MIVCATNNVYYGEVHARCSSQTFLKRTDRIVRPSASPSPSPSRPTYLCVTGRRQRSTRQGGGNLRGCKGRGECHTRLKNVTKNLDGLDESGRTLLSGFLSPFWQAEHPSSRGSNFCIVFRRCAWPVSGARGGVNISPLGTCQREIVGTLRSACFHFLCMPGCFWCTMPLRRDTMLLLSVGMYASVHVVRCLYIQQCCTALLHSVSGITLLLSSNWYSSSI